MQPDRPWQQRFIASFHASDEHNFLLVACPAAGKTLASVAVAERFERVVVVVPQRDIKDNWVSQFSKESERTSHDVTKDGMPIANHASVVVVTYAGLSRYVLELGVWLSRMPSLLVLDEIHHGGDSDRDGPTVWGQAAIDLSAKTKRSLLLTGTPLRTGGDRIPLVRYNAKDEPDPNLRYGFAEAWADDPCPIRRVRFAGHDAHVEWERLTGEDQATLSQMTQAEDEVAALQSALNPDGAFISDTLLDIKGEIEERRWFRPRAGALIVCRDQNHAREVEKVMRRLGMGDLSLVLSDDDAAREAIKRFRDGSTTYIVAVRMVSEGVDIPRLEVLGYFTSTRTRLAIHQIVGRVLRVVPGEEDVEAIVHYPMSWTLRKEIAEIEEALTYKVRPPVEGPGGGGDSTFIYGISTDAVQLEQSGSFGTVDRGRIDALRVEADLDEDQAIKVARLLLRQGELKEINPIERTRITPDPQSELEALRRECDKATKSLAGRMHHLGHGDYTDCIKKVRFDLKKAFDNRDPARLSAEDMREQLRIIGRWRVGLG